ncbi:hypothetical protein R3P38DRAFT_2923484 [Favolaschia claudopus]|uniref:Uncharacterized protein n=1 Tax=Favolaschia claudopus TaxID=2862362 RepID=A0AAW0BX01_9AGAR
MRLSVPSTSPQFFSTLVMLKIHFSLRTLSEPSPLRSLGSVCQRRPIHTPLSASRSRTPRFRVNVSRSRPTMFISRRGMAKATPPRLAEPSHIDPNTIQAYLDNSTLESLTIVRLLDSKKYPTVDFSNYRQSLDYFFFLVLSFPHTRDNEFAYKCLASPKELLRGDEDKIKQLVDIVPRISQTASARIHKILEAYKDSVWDTDCDKSREVTAAIFNIVLLNTMDLLRIVDAALGEMLDPLKDLKD